MAEIAGFAEAFAGAYAEVAVVLDERARRLLLGAGARQLGRGGIKAIATATGVSRDTVGRGAAELEAGVVADGRVRALGAGRKRVEHHDPGLWLALDELVAPETRGDPMSRLRWTTKSTARLAEELTRQGHRACHANRVSRGWTKIDHCDRYGGREGHPSGKERDRSRCGVRGGSPARRGS